MADKNIDKDTLKAQKDAEKAVEKAKKERIKQSKPKKEGNPFSRGGAAVKKFCKDFIGTCKKVSWPTGKQVIKNSGVVLATILVIGIAVALVDLALTSVFDLSKDAIGELGDKYAETTVAAVDTETTQAVATTLAQETTTASESETGNEESTTSAEEVTGEAATEETTTNEE